MPGLVPFGRYMLERRLAVGGMAELMLARAPGPDGFEKRVVIKRVIPARADDAHYGRMLADEARIAGHLTHPNVVQIYEFGDVDGQAFIAMEYLVGDDLETLIDQATNLARPIDVPIACYVAAEVAEGLHHAHVAVDEHGKPLNVVHRDVSPANIIVTNHGEIKIVDFGIAKHDMASTATASGIIKGKVAYMSPEQTRGVDLDARSDIFSLGIVLYEMLTLQPCFKEASLPATIDAIRKGKYVSLTALRPDAPMMVEQILTSMLAADREHRSSSAAEVSRSLRRFLAKVGTPTPQEVRDHLSALTERTIQVSPRILGTFADPNVVVGDAFAAPDMILDKDMLQTVITGSHTAPDMSTLPPIWTDAPIKTAPPVPSPFESELTDRPDVDGLNITYGTPPDTRIVSRLLLRMQRWGLEGFYNRMRLREAELRHFLSGQSPLVFAAVALLALCLGLGITLAFRTSSTTTAVTTVEPIDPATFKPQAPPAGRLKLETVPPGATVTVNGGPQPGVTPMVVDNIPVNVTQSVLLELKGYRSVAQDLTLTPTDHGRMYFLVTLVPEPAPTPRPTEAATAPPAEARPSEPVEPATTEPAPSPSPRSGGKHRDRDPEPGLLVLDSEPAMEVRINKRTLGRTPLKGSKLAPGTYAVQLIDTDFVKTVEVTVKAGKTTTSRIVLEKGKLLIDVRPWADVYIHNRKIGTTPLPPYELLEGEYKIRIVNPDMNIDRTLPVTIKRGKTTRVLEKL